MKKLVLFTMVVFLTLGIATQARSDSGLVEVHGTVTSVTHISNSDVILVFTLEQYSQAGATTVYASGALAVKWDSRIRRGMTLTVKGTERASQFGVIDAVEISK